MNQQIIRQESCSSYKTSTTQLYKHFLITSDQINSGKTTLSAYLASMLSYNQIPINYIKLSPALSTQINLLAPDISGECFVTGDGGQVDMDCGIIERSITQQLTKDSCLTLGKAIEEVNLKELQNKTCCYEFLNIDKNLIDWIAEYLRVQMNDKMTIIEIGGGITDIGGIIFDKAVQKLIENNYQVLNIHIGDKQIQQRKAQIYIDQCLYAEDFIHRQIPESIKSSFNEKIYQYLNIELPQADLFYTYLHSGYEIENKTVRIGIVGRYISNQDAYLSIVQTLRAAAHKLHININISYIQSLYLNENNIESNMQKIDGLVIPGGFGNVGQKGLICAIKYARTHKLPMIAICMGFQMTCVEFAENVCNLPDCDSYEINENCANPIIHQLSYIQAYLNDFNEAETNLLSNSSKDKYSLMNLGDLKISVVPDTVYSYIFDQPTERFWHSYALNMAYFDNLYKHGLRPVCYDYKKQVVMAVYIDDHPFFLATQFHPEFKSRFNQPHKMYVEFMSAVLKNKEQIQHNDKIDKQ